MLENLKLLLNGEKDITVEGAYSSAEDAMQSLKKSASPDVMLADLGLPGMSGVELIKRLRNIFPNLKLWHTLF